MAIDLEVVTPDIDLGIFKKLLGEKTHFIYELIQNADDSESTLLGLRLCENELFVWNDGRPFSQEDVQSICSTGSSGKDLTQIGNFGIGFKSVYNYTDLPEIYSNDVCFRIPYLKKPEAIDMDPRVAELLDKNTTVVFRLPFTDSLLPEDITNLENHLHNLEKKRSLLFLRYLKTIQWYDKKNGQTGSYFCLFPDKPRNPFKVELRASINGENQLSETFLIFRKKVQPQQDVIGRLKDQAENWKEEDRIQRSREELQSIEIAFKLQDGKITTLDGCMLFAYLPTEIKTNLRFLIQARYQTTPSRDNIVKPSESLWNRWLLQETANYLPEVLEQLKAEGLLEPEFFNVLPLKGEIEEAFKPISKALRKAMKERLLIPTQDGGYAKAENVFYPHRDSLSKLIESSWLYPNSNWLDPAIGLSGRVFDVMKEAGVKEIGVSQVLGWLEKQDRNWFESRCEEWMHSLYIYLSNQKSELERIKKLPLVRLENGRHVCASNELVFFPPDTDEECEKIEPFLGNLPILQSTLLEGEERNEIEVFLKSLEVRILRPVNLILKGICPQYRRFPQPSVEENRLHVRYLFEVWNDLSQFERNKLKGQISEIPILRAYKGIQHETENKNQSSVAEFHYVKPCDAYLPQVYTGDDDLETYFSVYDGEIWFVDDAYLENNSDAEVWLHFLKVFGVMNTPRITLRNSPAEEWDLLFEREVPRTGEDTCEQPEFEGMFYLLENESTVSFSKSLWNLLVKSLPSDRKKRDTFFQGTYQWFYYKPRFKPFNSFFFIILMREGKWLPDEQSNFDVPSKYFAPTPENRKLLGDSVTYLHPDFNIRTEPAQWLAEKLGVRLKPDKKNVLNHLQKLSSCKDASFEEVESLYHFLRREGVDAQLIQKFKKESLIFIPNPEPHWWRVDEVFWEDESEDFKNRRGYLKTHYPEKLKSFFTNLGVSPQASQQDYVLGIQEITTTEQAEDQKVRERVQRLYKSLRSYSVDKWEIYDNKCWLGKKGDEWGFFTRQELVLRDHPHIGELFEGDVPFWAFDGDLSSLARNLKVEGCSQAEVEFHPDGDQGEDTDWSEKVRKLRPYIYAFLNSPRLCEESDIVMFSGNEELQKEKFAKFSTNCSVQRVKELRVTYELKGTSVSDPNPRQSFLDVTDQQAKLWLGLEENGDEYPELIGDALQDYFGVKDLGRFIEDLLTKKPDRVLSNWKRKGLETKFLDEDPKDDEKKKIESLDEKFPDESNSGDAAPADAESDMRIPTNSETTKTDEEDDSLTDKVDESETHLFSSEGDDSKIDETESETPADSETTKIEESDNDSTSDEFENHTNLASDTMDISSSDTQSSTKTNSGTTQNVNRESESETPTVHEDPETENGNEDSTENESETPTYQSRLGGNRTRQHYGHRSNTSNRSRGTGYSAGGGGEGEEHRTLKEDLAGNPSQLGEGLTLVRTEYEFESGDRVDILLQDSFGNPVTVEVKPYILSESYGEVWQAVRYKHIAAVQYKLSSCKQVRSILAAPEIPDDVKAKCRELGIEPFEKPKL